MTQDIRLCFVGDSFVNGTGDETALGWAGRLCVQAARHGIPVTYYNLGVRRNTSQDILQRWENECALRLPDSCDARMVLSCGVNDTVIEAGGQRVEPGESCINIRQVLQVASTKYRVLMVGPPPVDDGAQNERIGKLSEAFARETHGLNISYIPLFPSLVSDATYIREISDNDGAHPRSSGYAAIAHIIASSPDWWFNPHAA